jgi:hypothetical protein
MRFNESLNITFKTIGNYSNVKIAPMILLPFVENSFKHGAIKNGLLSIKIHISYQDNCLKFHIENNALPEDSSENGIGLDNTKKRLNLLYKNSYTLIIKNEKEIFKVNLELKTS